MRPTNSNHNFNDAGDGRSFSTAMPPKKAQVIQNKVTPQVSGVHIHSSYFQSFGAGSKASNKLEQTRKPDDVCEEVK